MVTYRRTSHQTQDPLDLALIENAQLIDPTVAEAPRMGRREIKSLTFSELRRYICLDYELGCVSAEDTMKRLHDQGLYGSPETFITIFAAGVRSLAEMAVPGDPERSTDPIPSVSRTEPFRPEAAEK